MKNLKNKIKAIIFDMDGTIIKTEHVWQKVTNDFLTINGIEDPGSKYKDLIQSLSGIGLLRSAIILKKEFNLPQSEEEIVTQKLELSRNLFLKGVEFIDGFQNFHKKLKENLISTGIATNADIITLKTINEKLNLKSYFGSNIYSPEHIGSNLKPDPAIFLHTAKQLNAKPEECIVFEDSIYGFQAAKAAGMKCIAIKNTLNKDLLHQVHGAIDNYDQAEEELKKLSLL